MVTVNTNCFIIYTSAAGKSAAALEKGVPPGLVRIEPDIRSSTGFVAATTKYDGSKDGLIIKPRVTTADLPNNSLKFDILITKCNMSLRSSMLLTIKYPDETGKTTFSKDITLYIYCYGHDRPYLGTYKEYNCWSDVALDLQKISLESVNGLANTGFGSNDLDDSGFEIHTRSDSTSGATILGYSGSADKVGGYSIGLWGQTYESRTDTGLPQPSNPFPSGTASDIEMVSCYPNYFYENCMCTEVPHTVKLLNGLSDPTEPYCTVYAIYFLAHNWRRLGGVFLPVFGRIDNDDESKSLDYYKRFVSDADGETVYHDDFKIQLDERNEIWKLYYRSYYDNNIKEFALMASAAMRSLSVPVELDKATTQSVDCFCTLPPINPNSWTFEKDYEEFEDIHIECDGAKYISGLGYFHTAHLQQIGALTTIRMKPVLVYVSKDGSILAKRQEVTNIVNNRTVVAFPTCAKWTVFASRTNTSKTFDDSQVAEQQKSVIPYAPAARKNDQTFRLSPPTTSGVKDSSFAHAGRLLDWSPGNNSLVYSHCGGVFGCGAMLFWSRYPLQRVVPDGLNLVASVQVDKKLEGAVFTRSLRRANAKGTKLSYAGGLNQYPTALSAETYADIGEEESIVEDTAKNKFTASVNLGRCPLKGVKRSSDGSVEFFCDRLIDGSGGGNIKGSIPGGLWRNGITTWSETKTTSKVLEDKNEFREVPKPEKPDEMMKIPATYGYNPISIEDPIVSGSATKRFEGTYTEWPDTELTLRSQDLGSLDLDFYFYIGQLDTDYRKLYTGISCAGKVTVSGSCSVKTTETTIDADGREEKATSTADIDVTQTIHIDVAKRDEPGETYDPTNLQGTFENRAMAGDHKLGEKPSITSRTVSCGITNQQSGMNWMYGVELTSGDWGSGKYIHRWLDEDRDEHVEEYDVPTYALVGETKITEYQKYNSVSGSVSYSTSGKGSFSFSYNTASGAMSAEAFSQYSAEPNPEDPAEVSGDWPAVVQKHERSGNFLVWLGEAVVDFGEEIDITEVTPTDDQPKSHKVTTRYTPMFVYYDIDADTYTAKLISRSGEEFDVDISDPDSYNDKYKELTEEYVSYENHSPITVERLFETYIHRLPDKNCKLDDFPAEWQYGSDGCTIDLGVVILGDNGPSELSYTDIINGTPAAECTIKVITER